MFLLLLYIQCYSGFVTLRVFQVDFFHNCHQYNKIEMDKPVIITGQIMLDKGLVVSIEFIHIILV